MNYFDLKSETNEYDENDNLIGTSEEPFYEQSVVTYIWMEKFIN